MPKEKTTNLSENIKIQSHKGKGKQVHQKMKPYLVYQYLLENTDENHFIGAEKIADKIQDLYGIYAERRSIYRDIEEINIVNLMLEENLSIDEAAAMIADDEDDELKCVVYHKKEKGFYVQRRQFELDDIRLLVECIHSTKFLSERQANGLVRSISTLISKNQAKAINRESLLVDRVKADNKQMLTNIAAINEAMSKTQSGKKHIPEKITFKYLKYSIDDIHHQIERRHGNTYKVSPYHLLINDGYYYLLAFDDRAKAMRTYRVDRMKNIVFTNEPRDGEEDFQRLDMKNYVQRHFSMYSGKEKMITLKAINSLLDTMVDRFGKEKQGTYYIKQDNSHFLVKTPVAVNEQFYGWLLSFGKRVKIVAPDDVVEDFKAYLDKIRNEY